MGWRVKNALGDCRYLRRYHYGTWPLPGGWLADNWLGRQQRAVWYSSILIALSHLSITLSAVMGNNLFFIGLMFIVLRVRACSRPVSP